MSRINDILNTILGHRKTACRVGREQVYLSLVLASGVSGRVPCYPLSRVLEGKNRRLGAVYEFLSIMLSDKVDWEVQLHITRC